MKAKIFYFKSKKKEILKVVPMMAMIVTAAVWDCIININTRQRGELRL